MIFNIPVGGSAKTIVTVYGAASETVTLTAKNGKTFTTTTDATGKGGQLEIPVGVYTISGGHTEFSKSVTVDKTTTEVYAMPNGTIVYWYGYMPYEPVKKAWSPSHETRNGKTPEVELNERSIHVWQAVNGYDYCGSMLFDNVKTGGGVPVIWTSGKASTQSLARIHFSIANDITGNLFPTISTHEFSNEDRNVELQRVNAGTYDLAVSVRSYGWNGTGDTNVYAIYIEE